MLSSVNFDYKIGGSTVKIDNILTDNLLPFYCYRQTLKKIVPKMAFLGSHIPAQYLSIGL